MIALLALAAAAAQPQSVAQAERAFAAAAARDGQWTAFRATAAPEGVMFAPEIVNAQSFLKGRPDPRTPPLRWAPAFTFTSCDGNLALSTGPWAAGQGHGTFTTIWKHKPGSGWRWLYDSGRDTPRALPLSAQTLETRASCATPPATGPGLPAGQSDLQSLLQGDAEVIVQEDNRNPSHQVSAPRRVVIGRPLISGMSGDKTLVWAAAPIAGEKPGAHLLRVWTWTGGGYRLRLMDVVGLKTP